MKEIVIATKNKGKIAEIAAALSQLPVTILALSDFGDIPDAIEDGKTFLENAIIKAKYYAHHTGKACLADDSGLEVDALAGAPGVYSARYAGVAADDTANNAKLLAQLQGMASDKRTARFRCVLAFVDGDVVLTADGVCEGTILSEPRGSGGFGYDPLFYLEDLSKSMAEISMEEKNKRSHRGAALTSMAGRLAGYFGEDWRNK